MLIGYLNPSGGVSLRAFWGELGCNGSSLMPAPSASLERHSSMPRTHESPIPSTTPQAQAKL